MEYGIIKANENEWTEEVLEELKVEVEEYEILLAILGDEVMQEMYAEYTEYNHKHIYDITPSMFRGFYKYLVSNLIEY
jgi:hypothetical protein